MQGSHKELISISLTIAIVCLTLFIIHRFIPSLVWASIIVIATFPLYQKWRNLFSFHKDWAAFTFTLILALLVIVPITWLASLLIKELQLFFSYLQEINRNGGQPPSFLIQIPQVGQEIVKWWNENFGQPGKVKEVLSNLHVSLTPTSYYIKKIGSNVAHRGVQLGFTVLCLFFFFRDGEALFQQINHIGEACLGRRWFRYADRLPLALRATVNGTMVVGIGVGLLMGICYALVQFPAPTLMGFITAFAAMIPFVAPLVFGIIAIILVFSGAMVPALIVIIWGSVVLFVADHFIKPVLIGGAIELPFLAVLFSILGGAETLGLLGLFVGPIIMVFFMTLWHESQNEFVASKTSLQF